MRNAGYKPISRIRDSFKASGGPPQRTPSYKYTAIAPAGYPALKSESDPADRNATINLSYPLNVEESPQGHYITFYIRVVNPPKLQAFKKAKANIAAVEKKLAVYASAAFRRFGDTAAAAAISEQQLDQYKSDKALVEGNKQAESGLSRNSIVLKSQPSVRLEGAISLYMHPNVQVSYETKYGEQEICLLYTYQRPRDRQKRRMP